MSAAGGAEAGRGADAAPAPVVLPVVLPVRLRAVQRVLLFRELVESAPAALTLLGAGVAGLRARAATPADRALAVAEVASSAWMLVLLRRELRETLGRGGAGGAVEEPPSVDEQLAGVEWSGVAGAAMLGVEAWQHWRQTGHVQRPVVLLAVVTLYLATGGRRAVARLLSRRLGDRRPRLVLSAEGVDYRATRRRRWAASWDEVARVAHDPDAVRLTLRDGTVREIAARAHVDGDRLVAAVRRALPALLPERLMPSA